MRSTIIKPSRGDLYVQSNQASCGTTSGFRRVILSVTLFVGAIYGTGLARSNDELAASQGYEIRMAIGSLEDEDGFNLYNADFEDAQTGKIIREFRARSLKRLGPSGDGAYIFYPSRRGEFDDMVFSFDEIDYMLFDGKYLYLVSRGNKSNNPDYKIDKLYTDFRVRGRDSSGHESVFHPRIGKTQFIYFERE